MFLTPNSMTGLLAVGMLAAAGAVGCAAVKQVPPPVRPAEPIQPAVPATSPQSPPPAPDNSRTAVQAAPARPAAVAPPTPARLPTPVPPSFRAIAPPVQTAPPVRIAPPVAAAPGIAAAPLDVTSLETRLRATNAIGVLTKLSLKRQVDDLLAQFSAYHNRQSFVPLADLRRSFDLLLLKVLSLLQDSDPALARDVNASRAALWGVLADPQKFRSAHLMAGDMQ